MALKNSFILELKANFALSIPLMSAWMVYGLSGFIATAMVSHLGKEALAASVIVNSVWTTLAVFFFSIFTGISVIISQAYGAKRYEDISKTMGQAFLLGILVCIPISLTLACMPYLLTLFSYRDPNVLKLAITYAHTLMLSGPAVVVLAILEYFLNGIGRTKLSLWISLLEVPLEICLMYIFMFGKLGLPALGIAGVGYGFTLSYTLTVICVLIYLYHARYFKPFAIFHAIFKFNKKYFLEILRIGLPIGLMYLIEVLAFLMATLLIAHFDTVKLAAHQIAMQYLGLTINIAFAMAQTASIRIGQAVGRKDIVGIRLAGFTSLGLGCFLILLLSTIYISYPEFILLIDFSTLTTPLDAALLQQAIGLLIILAVFQLFDNFRIIEVGILAGLKDTRFPMWVSLVSFWLIGLVAAYGFGFILDWQAQGVWIGLSLGVLIGAVILLCRMRTLLSYAYLQQLLVLPASNPSCHLKPTTGEQPTTKNTLDLARDLSK
jgi:multidrug resistance protein, MATE family